MRKILIVILACCTLNAFAEKNFIDQNYVEVVAKAEQKVAPNEIVIRIILDESHYQKETIKSLEKRLKSALKKAGIEIEKQLKIKDLSSELTKKFLSKKIKAIQEYSLTVNSGEELLHVFSALSEAQIADFEIEHIAHTQIDSLRSELRVLAVKKARQQAVDLASAVDQQIGRAIFIYENSNDLYMPRYNKAAMLTYVDNESAEKPPLLEFEPIAISTIVTVRFELK